MIEKIFRLASLEFFSAKGCGKSRSFRHAFVFFLGLIAFPFAALPQPAQVDPLIDPQGVLSPSERVAIVSLLQEYDSRDGCHSHIAFWKRPSQGTVFYAAMEVWRELENRYPEGRYRLFAFSTESPADHFESGGCQGISNRAQYDLSQEKVLPALAEGRNLDAVKAQIEGIDEDARRWRDRRNLNKTMEWVAGVLIGILILVLPLFDVRNYLRLKRRFRALVAEQEASGYTPLPAYWASEAHYRKFFKRPAEFERIGVLIPGVRRLTFISEAYKGGERHVMEMDPAQCRLSWKGRNYFKGWFFWIQLEVQGQKHYFSAGVPISYLFRNIWYFIARSRSKALFKALRSHLGQ